MGQQLHFHLLACSLDTRGVVSSYRLVFFLLDGFFLINGPRLELDQSHRTVHQFVRLDLDQHQHRVVHHSARPDSGPPLLELV